MPQLLQQAQTVGHTPVLDHPVVLIPSHVDHVDPERPSCGREAELAAVVAAGRPDADPHGVAADGAVDDLHVEVRGARAQDACHLSRSGGSGHPRRTVRRFELVLQEVGRDEFVQYLVIAAVEHLVDQTGEQGQWVAHRSAPSRVDDIHSSSTRMNHVSDSVKARAYDSSLRTERARENRAAILGAAHELFVAQGYASTSVAAIAREAGVSADLIYKVFTNKRRLLVEVLNFVVIQDPEARSLQEQEGPRAVKAETDQRRQVAMLAADITASSIRARPVDDV